ncbi:MAG: glutamate mutase L [Symbiobacteriaceae bacterium]|nr:glutamate mutase L [Symbiobacteriaceae bacterium]
MNTNNIVIVDVGSTTTKALLFQYKEETWHYRERGEAATTVEAPDEDVMLGVWRALQTLSDRSGVPLVTEGQLICDAFLATSSAGGGLQMVVCGNISHVTGESAKRAALGGGAVLLDLFTVDDGRHHFHRLERLRTLRPDMILLSGGIEGAQNINFMIEMCDFIRIAKPKPKFGYHHRLPVVYAGASRAIPVVEELLSEDFHLKVVPNLRPTMDGENLAPTREAIHELFIEHVMSHAPGYHHLQELVTHPLLPTPSAVGEILTRYARQVDSNILCIDIGGATTDIFSVVEGRYVRSVSANLGMSYSIGNVVATTGLENILHWLSPDLSLTQVKRSIGAKLFHPISIPATTTDLLVEQAVAREAIRLAFQDHRELATIQAPRSIFVSELLLQPGQIHVDAFDIIIGSGGVLCNAPERHQATLMLLDALQPCGVTKLYVDSVFMLPHLGVFAMMDESSALSALRQDCLVPLGTVIAPWGTPRGGAVALRLQGSTSQGSSFDITVPGGRVEMIPLAAEESANLEITLSGGATWHGPRRFVVTGGDSGIIIDTRGRPPQN